jgi:hypothetical protein
VPKKRAVNSRMLMSVLPDELEALGET